MARIKARSGRVFARFDGFGDGANLPPVSQCSVDTITKAGGDTWNNYCDCMFTAPGTEDQYFLNGVRQYPIGVTAAAMIAAWSKQPGFSIKTVVVPQRSADWAKCVMKFCADPNGCDDPVTKRHSNFNVNPNIGFAPWTELGASARGIPKRNAGFWYDFGSVFNIDQSEYEPIKLWVTYWNNPAKFLLLAAKASLFPGAAILTAALTAGQIAVMYPYVLAEVQAKGLDWKTYVFDPMGKGWIKFGKLLLSWAGKCGIGIPGACAVGVVVRQACQDQIDDGSINGIQDPAIKSTIIFLAQYGDVLTDRIYSVIKNASKIAKDPSIWSWLSSVFLGLSQLPLQNYFDKTDKKAQKDVASLKLFFILGSKVFKMAAVIAQGLAEDRPITTVIDDACAALIGFRPTDISSLWQQGTAGMNSAHTIISNAEQREGMSLDQMGKLAGALGSALGAIVKALGDINGKVGGNITDLINEIKGTADVFSTVTQTTSNVVTQLAQQTGHTSPPAAPGTAPVAVAPRSVPTQPGYVAPPMHLKRSPLELAAPLVLAAGGFAVGGPIGAAVAGAVGYFFTRPGASTSIAGFGAAPRRRRRVRMVSSHQLGIAPLVTRGGQAAAAAGGAPQQIQSGVLNARLTTVSPVVWASLMNRAPPQLMASVQSRMVHQMAAGQPVTPPPTYYQPPPPPAVVSVTQATGTQVTDAGVTASPDDNEFSPDLDSTGSNLDTSVAAASGGVYTDPGGNQYADQGNGTYADGSGNLFTVDPTTGEMVALQPAAPPADQTWDQQVNNAQIVVGGQGISVDDTNGVVIPQGMSVTPVGGGPQMFVPPPPPSGITPGKVLVGAGIALALFAILD